MLTFVFGAPGSGKTVYAIDKIISIQEGKEKSFEHIEIIYNNIAGFKFDMINSSMGNPHGVMNKKLNFNMGEDNLYLKLKTLYDLFNMNQSKSNVDDILIEYCKDKNIFNALFVLDECHNYFDVQDKALVWWLSYHRHLHHELIFLTQNKSMIHSKYRGIPELFIQAQPRSKAIKDNTMRYYHYTSFAMPEKDKFNISSLTVTPQHFELYKSGNFSKQKKVGLKLIYSLIFVFIILIIVFVALFSSMSPDIKEDIETTNKKEVLNNPNKLDPTQTVYEEKQHFQDYKDKQYLSLICNSSICTHNGITISLKFYLSLRENEIINQMSLVPIKNGFYRVEFFAPNYVYEIFYNKEVTGNEKINILSDDNN